MAFLRAYALLPGSPHGQCLKVGWLRGKIQFITAENLVENFHSVQSVFSVRNAIDCVVWLWEDTEEVKGSCHIDDSVSGLRLLA